MILNLENWKEKRVLAKQHLSLAKKENDIQACKAAAWEIEFWGRVSILESKMNQLGQDATWLQEEIKDVLLADERYYIVVAAKESEYQMIPIKIRAFFNDQCRIS